MKRFLLLVLALPVLALAGGAAWTALGVRAIESELPPVGRFVTVDGIRLHYTDQGSGPPLVLVHGASSNLREFQVSVVPLLAKRHRVLAFDRPGFGYSERGPSEWMDPGRLAALLLDAGESLGVTRPVIVGHSWAGAVVMSALLREPGRVAAGVLLAGVAGHWVGDEDVIERLRDWPAINAVFAHTLVYPVGSRLLPSALEEVFAPHPVPPGHAERAGVALALRPDTYLHNAEDMNRLSAFLQRESARYAAIGSRLLVIHGRADTLVPFWNHGRRLCSVLDRIEIELLDGVGHVPHHVAPREVADLIAGFAGRVHAGVERNAEYECVHLGQDPR